MLFSLLLVSIDTKMKLFKGMSMSGVFWSQLTLNLWGGCVLWSSGGGTIPPGIVLMCYWQSWKATLTLRLIGLELRCLLTIHAQMFERKQMQDIVFWMSFWPLLKAGLGFINNKHFKPSQSQRWENILFINCKTGQQFLLTVRICCCDIFCSFRMEVI